jgi:amino acid adenylation domain-containing protein
MKNIFPLTPTQEGILYHCLEDPKSNVYLEQFYVKIVGQLDIELFKKSVNFVYNKHEMLRCNIVYEKFAKPQHIIRHHTTIDVPYIDISNNCDPDAESFVNELKKKDLEKGFDLQNGFLFRFSVVKISPISFGILFSFHHLIMDGWCSSIILKDIIDYYSWFKQNPTSVNYSTINTKYTFSDYISWLSVRNQQEDRLFWSNYLMGSIESTELPMIKKPNVSKYKLDKVTLLLSKEKTRKLYSLAKQNQVTLSTVFQSLWALLLNKICNKEIVVFGIVVSGRPPYIEEIENVVGLFVNSVPLKVSFLNIKTFRDIMIRIHYDINNIKQHENISIAEIKEFLSIEEPLFDHIIAFENYPFEEELLSHSLRDKTGFSIGAIEDYEQTNYNFDIIIVPGEELKVNFKFNDAFYFKEDIESLSTSLDYIIDQILENEKINLSDIQLINNAKNGINSFNNTETIFPFGKTILDIFKDICVTIPNEKALLLNEKSVTYRDLDKESNKIANFLLHNLKIQNEEKVGVLIERSLEMMNAIWGILKSGATYVPLDVMSPEERTESVIETANIKIVLSVKKHLRLLNRLLWSKNPFEKYICLDSEHVNTEVEEGNGLMDENLWNNVAKSYEDDIQKGGWQNSYNGKPFSVKEMEEYSQNTFNKLASYLEKSPKILEIGCASGLTTYKISPYSSKYVATDLSTEIINYHINSNKNNSILFEALPAHEIDKYKNEDFDIVIMNSVVHCFNGHNYFKNVIKESINCLAEKGHIFIGDVLNLDLKNSFLQDLINYNADNKNENIRTKLDWSNELFLSSAFFENLKNEIQEIKNISITKKEYTIENELTNYRFDVIIEIDKNNIESKKYVRNQFDKENINSVSDEQPIVHIDPTSLAYIIFTSGTTGKPKGVMIEHQSLVNRLNWMQKLYPISHEDVLIQKTPITFDVSIWELFWWSLNKSALCILGHGDEKDPKKIISAIEQYRVSVIHFVPSMLQPFLDYVETNNLTESIKSLKYCICSGEALLWVTAKKFIKLIGNRTLLVNLYGPTEATIDVTYYNCNDIDTLSTIPIGKPVENTKVHILNKDLNELPIGFPGNIYIEGIQLARGYINDSKHTNDSFLLKDNHKIYKTGDIGRWLKDGNIEYIGRCDNQVKIRGFRIELSEIEYQIFQCLGVSNAAVITRGNADEKFLCAYFTGSIESKELREHLYKFLPKYMIPPFIIKMEKLPYTNNGKLDRKKLPDPLVRKSHLTETPQNEIEEKLHAIWLNIIKVSSLSTMDNFFDLGGNSIKIIQIISEIQKELNVEVNIKEFTQERTIRNLSNLIISKQDKETHFTYPQIEPNKKDFFKPFPLTEVQKAYIAGRNDEFELGGTSTHIYKEFDTQLDINRINYAINILIERHPILRTIINEDGTQYFIENKEYKIDVEDIRNLSTDIKKQEIERIRQEMSHYVFPIGIWPLFNIKVLIVTDTLSRLFISMDVLITDATSSSILLKELKSLYEEREKELPEISFTFRDYIIQYEKIKTTKRYDDDRNFWLKKIKHSFPVELPFKNFPSEISNPIFRRLSKTINSEQYEKLKKVVGSHNITPSGFLATIFAEVIALYSNHTSILLNMTLFNRFPFHDDIYNIVGDFTSILILFLELDNNLSFWENAKNTQNVIWESMDHRHFDGVSVLRELGQKHKTAHKALAPYVFTSTLAGNTESTDWMESKNPVFEPYSISQTPQVFIDSQASEINNQLVLIWDFVDQLFDEQMISDMFSIYTDRIEELINGSEHRSISITKDQEAFYNNYNNDNETNELYSPSTLLELLSTSLNENSEKIAIVVNRNSHSYSELERKSNIISNWLINNKITKGDVVAIIDDRSFNSIMGIIGILKAGAVYLPFYANMPEERIQYIIDNSNCKLVLSNIDSILYNNEKLFTKVEYNVSESDLAYIIYTSGSTGKPKGVEITHQGAVNTILDINKKFEVNKDDKILGISSLGFDLSVFDIFGTFAAGATLVVVKDPRDEVELLKLLKEERVTIWNSVPSIMGLALDAIENNVYENAYFTSVPHNIYNCKYYWSPIVHWKKLNNGTITINNHIHSSTVGELFPQFYFILQEGATVRQIIDHFTMSEESVIRDILLDFIDKKIITNSILAPENLFSSQNRLFDNSFDETIVLNATKYNSFKKEQITRNLHSGTIEVDLEHDIAFENLFQKRRSFRKFETGKSIPKIDFSKLLSVFKQYEINNQLYFNYASAGGLYPIDIYLYIKEGRIEQFDKGFYYYNPVKHKLVKLNNKNVGADIHFPGNQKIFNSSAFSVFFVYNAEVNMPKYGGMGYYYAVLDTGIMVGTMTQAAEQLNIGLCSIGNLVTEKIKTYLPLKETQVLFHTIEVGIKTRKIEAESSEDVQVLQLESSFSEHLRLVMLSGDWIPVAMPDKIKKKFKNTEIISLGGATEASIWSIYYSIKNVEKDWDSIPYGYPLANQQIYILNYERELCPIGVIGEIYIGGAGVAEGYCNDLEKTKTAFIRHYKYGRLYKTGDYGVMRKEGYIQFLGRKDNQVKLRGYRIELGEIEAAMNSMKPVKNSIVVLKGTTDNEKCLCAYYLSDNEIGIQEFRDYLINKIPVYMIPSYFVKLEQFPVTLNGKIDRKAIANITHIKKEEQLSVQPLFQIKHKNDDNNLELKILQIATKVLPNKNLNVNDNFFELGLNSLDITRLNRKIKEELKMEIPILSMFEHPSISMFSEYVRVLKQNDVEKITDINQSFKKSDSTNRLIQRRSNRE